MVAGCPACSSAARGQQSAAAASGVTVSGSNAVVATLSGSVAAPSRSPFAGRRRHQHLVHRRRRRAPVTVTINAATYPDAASLVTAMQAAVDATGSSGLQEKSWSVTTPPATSRSVRRLPAVPRR
jgi:hypothetical protein